MIGRLQAVKLPTSLRQDVVFHLGGELIATIVDLQRELGNAHNTFRTWINLSQIGVGGYPFD
jgi:hypothetical protein